MPQPFDLSQTLIAGLAGVGRLDPSIGMLFKLAEGCRNAPREKIPSLEEIIRHLDTHSRFTLPNKETITKDELKSLKALSAIIDQIGIVDERCRLGPTRGMLRQAG